MLEEECPYCYSKEFDITDETSEDLSMYRDCRCLDCDKEFTLCYDLTLTNTIEREYC